MTVEFVGVIFFIDDTGISDYRFDAMRSSHTEPMKVEQENGNGGYRYACDLTCQMSGRYGFTARITPKGDDKITYTPELFTWAQPFIR